MYNGVQIFNSPNIKTRHWTGTSFRYVRLVSLQTIYLITILILSYISKYRNGRFSGTFPSRIICVCACVFRVSTSGQTPSSQELCYSPNTTFNCTVKSLSSLVYRFVKSPFIILGRTGDLGGQKLHRLSGRLNASFKLRKA